MQHAEQCSEPRHLLWGMLSNAVSQDISQLQTLSLTHWLLCVMRSMAGSHPWLDWK